MKEVFVVYIFLMLVIQVGCEVSRHLLRIIVGRYLELYRRGPSAEVVSKLLFFTLYGEGEPVLRLPEHFTIYLKGPFIPVDRLAERCGIDVVRVGDSYYVKKPGEAAAEGAAALRRMGLGELAETAMKVVEAYGRKSEEKLAELALKKLGLEGDVKALAFNVDLDAYLDFRRRLKETLKKTKYTDEVEEFPDLFSNV
ncbi:hypothetical protein ODS41_10905 [Pyrobaculum sp. 3827-6]|nr:hypothetical protein [Pyrobaculum sp. 3827-6]